MNSINMHPSILVNGFPLTSSQVRVTGVAVALVHAQARQSLAARESERIREFLDRLTEVLGFMWAMESGGTNGG